MIAELSIDFNELTFVAGDEFMKIDIQPEHALVPVCNLPADKQPALTYLAGLGRSSQRTQWSALCVVAAVLTACAHDLTAAGVRDAAILGLAIRCGLRRAEIAKLELDDYNQVEEKLTVRGKGNKTRVVHVTPGAAAVLADWLAVRGAAPGRLLLPVNKGGRIEGDGITDAAVYDAMAKRAEQAGVKKFSPHDGRRTFAGDLLDAGADISTVQQLMGHADPRTTAGYDRRPEHTKRAAVNRLHMRWERRY